MTQKHLVKLNLARNCLRYIIRVYQIKEIHMPYYICPAVWQAVRNENCFIKFYHIDKNFYPVTKFKPDDFILYPNYFGICAKNILKLNNQYKNLIVDNAHNFFMPDFGLASFNSLRKIFNVKDGAFLNISKLSTEIFPKSNHFYEIDNEETYENFCKNELRLNKESIKLISEYTENLFKNINLEKEKQKRIEIFNKIHTKLKNTNKIELQLSTLDVPFVYPYLTYDKNFNKNLEKDGVLLLRYWEALPESFPEYEFYKHLIPIPLNTNVLNSRSIF